MKSKIDMYEMVELKQGEIDLGGSGPVHVEGERVASAVRVGGAPEGRVDHDLARGTGERLKGIARAVGPGHAANKVVVAPVAGHGDLPLLRDDLLGWTKVHPVRRAIARRHRRVEGVVLARRTADSNRSWL